MIPSCEDMYGALEARHGRELQKKLSEAKVAVCGLGGLGSNAAVHLARAGVGELMLFDMDKVDITNLHRQQYFTDQLGQPKAAALAETLGRIAPYCKITAHEVELTEDNMAELLKDCHIVCECFDKADQKAMLVNFVLENFPDKYMIAASGMAGLASANEICTRRITKHFYLCGDGHTDVNEAGTLFASRVAVCAAHQANMVIRIISGETEP
ncbi:MAG: sulfur carrier protein ThiS adenylyltransferase ThiF [Ruminococcus sp.]|uniref:sulfur carrier protein ThiS adenylyltransferase ThiF n=1 Tax=Ruminococcus sp. TaxID=41978 RepID=UPI0025EDBFD3|nr:sulfur carrier protein ThiS adenylyltransferase ThiF [Ruminococcus sp.]MBR0529957.1 sulfur carrier protein ThiS adenylyltransferase ThiF [Ruminococcus sp.]